MRILVTGAGGQIGAALVAKLGSSTTVVATDRSTLDLSRPELVSKILDRLEPHLVINAAAYTAVDQAETEADLAYCVNAEAPGVMARWAAARDIPFIHFSTDYVFDGSGSRPWSEDDPARPLSVYGASKLAGEDQVRSAMGPSLIIRTSWVYAAKGNNFLRKIVHAAATQRELRVVGDQVGAPTPAALVAGTVAAMLSGGPRTFRGRVKESGGLVHLAAAGETSWHGFATEIVNGLRDRGCALEIERIVSIETEDWPSPARRPYNSRLDLERLRAVFGVKPADWRAALAPELDQVARTATVA